MLSSRKQLIAELSELALPLMWTMRKDAVKACEPLGLRPIQSLLLTFIAKNMQHPKHIAEMLDVHPPAISAMLAELETSGYVQRSIDPNDRRRIRLELTQAGHELLKKVDEAYCEKSLERMQHLSDDELRNLVNIHRKLIEP